jgi:hypothetical protein
MLAAAPSVGEPPAPAVSDGAGQYVFPALAPFVDFAIAPARAAASEDRIGLSAYDASLVLQYTVAGETLSAHQLIAADTNANGFVTAFDASQILIATVDDDAYPYPTSPAVWVFAPGGRDYPAIDADHPAQDYLAIMIGDVNGSWTPPSPLGEIGLDALKPQPVIEEAPTARLVVESVEGAPGGRIVAVVRAEGIASLLALTDLRIDFDPAVASVVAVRPGVMLAGMMSVARIDEAAGLVRFSASAAAPIDADGALIEIEFAIAAEAQSGADSPLRALSVRLEDADGRPIAAKLIDGELRIR